MRTSLLDNWLIISALAMCCVDGILHACDWSGSGLNSRGSGREITPVYLTCFEGTVEWQYPSGALRVVLKYGSKNKDFHACIKVRPDFRGARLYVEGHRTLRVLYSSDDGKPKDYPRCFYSANGYAAVYVEAESSQDISKSVATFSYDLQSVVDDPYTDPLEDCRPCTDSELLRSYCSGDFVARGRIASIHNNIELDRTEIVVKSTKIHRQSSPIFRDRQIRHAGELHANEIDSDTSVEEDVYGLSGVYGTLHVPLKCGARSGGDELMFIGRMKLGDPVLKCAPTIEQWNELRRTAISEGTNECILDS